MIGSNQSNHRVGFGDSQPYSYMQNIVINSYIQNSLLTGDHGTLYWLLESRFVIPF